MTSIRAGDRAALEILLDRYADRIFGFGVRMCRDREDAREVLQETMLAVARSAEGWRGDAEVSSWLWSIARNACAKRRRRRAGEPSSLDSFDSLPETAAIGGDPEDELVRQRLRQRLETALDGLSDAHREVIVLRDIEGLSAREVAEATDSTVGAVKSRLHRARAELRASLEENITPEAPRRGCPDILTALSASLEDELDAKACEAMQRHVDGCSRCGAECDALKAVLAVCASAPHEPVPPEVAAELRRVLDDALASGQTKPTG